MAALTIRHLRSLRSTLSSPDSRRLANTDVPEFRAGPQHPTGANEHKENAASSTIRWIAATKAQ